MPKKKGFPMFLEWLSLIIALIVTVALGTLFIDGQFLNVMILKYIPAVGHTVVGWVLVISAFIPLVNKLL